MESQNHAVVRMVELKGPEILPPFTKAKMLSTVRGTAWTNTSDKNPADGETPPPHVRAVTCVAQPGWNRIFALTPTLPIL